MAGAATGADDAARGLGEELDVEAVDPLADDRPQQRDERDHRQRERRDDRHRHQPVLGAAGALDRARPGVDADRRDDHRPDDEEAGGEDPEPPTGRSTGR